WDAIGVREMLKIMEDFDLAPAPWVYAMLEKGFDTFYKIENGRKLYYDIPTGSYKVVPGQESFIILENISDQIIWKNSGSAIYDLGDGIINLEFRSKMNTMGPEVIEGIHKAIALAEKDFRGLVIGNDS